MKGTCIYVDGGMGHYVPAKTVKKELEEKGLKMDIQEFFSLLDIEWLGKINKYFWRTMLKNSKLENKISSYNDKSNGMVFAVKYGIKHCSSILISYIERMHPDFFFTTHPYAGTVISEILKAKNIDIPVYYFATDVFSAPIAAICNSLRRFYISTEEGREIVIKMGMMPEKVVLSPFPLQQRVQDAERLTKKKARKKLGIREDVFTIQFNLGGEGVGSIEVLKALSKENLNLQILVVGGVDNEMEKRIEEIASTLPPNIKLICAGFIENVYDYLAASDIIVGRAGINTLVEAFYARRPFLITELVYTVMNSADYVEKYNVGWNCNRNPEKQINTILRLINNPEELDEIDRNFDSIPIRFSASELADMLIKDVRDYQEENH